MTTAALRPRVSEPPSTEASNRASGFTIIELVVASGVALVVLFLAMDTLRVSTASVAIVGEESQLRSRQWPVTLLRRDVRRGTRLGRESPQWSDGALAVVTDAGVITYRRTPERHLQRSFQPTAGSTGSGGLAASEDEAIILYNTSLWRWRSLPGGLVQIEFAVRSRRGRADIHGHRSHRLESITLRRRAGVQPARW